MTTLTPHEIYYKVVALKPCKSGREHVSEYIWGKGAADERMASCWDNAPLEWKLWLISKVDPSRTKWQLFKAAIEELEYIIPDYDLIISRLTMRIQLGDFFQIAHDKSRTPNVDAILRNITRADFWLTYSNAICYLNTYEVDMNEAVSAAYPYARIVALLAAVQS